jgi:hypothetical protein
MKFGPRQFIGLAAIIVFGGILVFNFTKPKRDPMVLPSGVDLRDLPSPGGATPQPEQMTVHIAEDPLTIGSDDAKDDLYCSGIIFTAHKATGDIASPAAQSRRDAVIALADAGVAKLIAEGAATKDTTASVADAQANLAETDSKAATPRISLADCTARADVLKAATPAPAPN